MTTPTDIERISYGGASGSLQLGAHKQVIQGEGSTRTLLAKESGSLVLFDRAAGIVYTLPTAVEGMHFDFLATVSVTSNAYKTITSAATQFMVGGIVISSLTVAESGDTFTADGTSIVAISEDGATKGGLLGGWYRVTAISSTVWAIRGLSCGAGTLATPFATS